VLAYRTFDDLDRLMKREITGGLYTTIIHSAAISDYRVAGVFAKDDGGQLIDIDAAGKVASTHNELFLRLTPTPKLIDKIRRDWFFTGTLVKFKLEVGLTDLELIEVATKSMFASGADLIVANCLEWSADYALLIKPDGSYAKVTRKRLPDKLWWHLSELWGSV
jgi:phosphopantothenate-cysteine ligase/phosphopantothenoylcysteine decarboxylase/phosphopantothenate--cysteine ligase